MRSQPITMDDGQGGLVVSDMEFARAKRFLNRLRSQPFIAILVDAEKDEVRMYVKGVDVNGSTLRRMRELLDELEDQMDA